MDDKEVMQHSGEQLPVSTRHNASPGPHEGRASWRNRDPASMTEAEMDEALAFCSAAYDEVREWAPVAVWAFFAAVRADLTVEQAKRLKRASVLECRAV